MNQHVGHAVLERLELADWLAELLARLQVLARGVEKGLHAPHGVGAERRQRHVLRVVEGRAPGPLGAEERVGLHVRVFERHVGRAATVDCEVLAHADAAQGARYREHGEALAGRPGRADTSSVSAAPAPRMTAFRAR